MKSLCLLELANQFFREIKVVDETVEQHIEKPDTVRFNDHIDQLGETLVILVISCNFTRIGLLLHSKAQLKGL